MKNLITISILFLNFFAFSQNHELGKVTIEELKEKACPMDTSAVAAVLFNIGKTHYSYSDNNGFELMTEISTKIKIYKKEGYEYANQAINFYVGENSSEKVSVSKAYTYNLVDGKIEKTKLDGDSQFIEKVNKFWSRKKIAMPNVKEGCVIEFKFDISSPYESDIPEWEFQKKIPVIYSEFSTIIPEYYIFNTSYKGYLNPIVQIEKKANSITITSKQRSNAFVTSTTFSNQTINFDETKTKYVLENIPALRDEVFVNNINNYRATVLHELSAKRFPDTGYKSFSTDWESVVKTIYQNENFGDELKKTGYFEKDLDAILNGVSSYEEKIAIVFNYVKSRMNWNETNGVYCDGGVKKAYQDKKGSTPEINLMLTAMLRYAGIEANPILVSTRSNGISIFPSRTSYNYVIAGVELQNKVILLDATNKNTQPNILPIRDLNWFGRIIRKNESSAQIDLMPTSNSNEVVSIMASINEKGEVSGKIRDQYFDYNAFVFRENNNDISKDSYVEKLEKKHQGLEVGNYEVQNKTDLSKPVVENYEFISTNSVEIIGDKMYFSPFLIFATTENPFKQEIREYPVDFVFPNEDKFNISIKIPEGYIVETLPKASAMAMPENLGNFKYNISNNGNQIQLLYTLDINQAIIGSEDYDILKNFFKEVVNKQTEKIVLKKS